MEPLPHMAGSSKGKVFRPLLCWFIVSMLLLTWRHHQQQERSASIVFSVSIEGRPGNSLYTVTLNQRSFETADHSGLGRKKLFIQAKDADLFVTNVFVWYGGRNLGNITLPRSRGTLSLDITPRALHLEVTNNEAHRVLH